MPSISWVLSLSPDILDGSQSVLWGPPHMCGAGSFEGERPLEKDEFYSVLRASPAQISHREVADPLGCDDVVNNTYHLLSSSCTRDTMQSMLPALSNLTSLLTSLKR